MNNIFTAETVSPGHPDKIADLFDQGLILDSNNIISASQRGRPVLNHIIRKLAG